MEELRNWITAHPSYLALAGGIAAALLLALRFLLNRPSQEEKNHRKRLQKIQDQTKDRYRTLRPLR